MPRCQRCRTAPVANPGDYCDPCWAVAVSAEWWWDDQDQLHVGRLAA